MVLPCRHTVHWGGWRSAAWRSWQRRSRSRCREFPPTCPSPTRSSLPPRSCSDRPPATVTIADRQLDRVAAASERRSTTPVQLRPAAASALWCGAHMYYLLSQQPTVTRRIVAGDDHGCPVSLACAAVYFLLNSGLTAEAVALSKGLSALKFWRQHFLVDLAQLPRRCLGRVYLFVLLRSAGRRGGGRCGGHPTDSGVSPGDALVARASG